jgi:hypothetical protein
MADSRSVTVTHERSKADPSGLGGLMFQGLEEQRKRKEALEDLDITESIRTKYRMQESAAANQFAEAQTRLRHMLGQQATDLAFERERQARQEGAAQLESMIGEGLSQGVPMPGLTQTSPLPEGVAGPVKPAVKPITPGGLDIAKEGYFKNLTEHLKLQGTAAATLLAEQLDLMDERSASEAAAFASSLEAMDAPEWLQEQARQFTTPGRGSKQAWAAFRDKTYPEFRKYEAQHAAKMELAKEISARQREIADLKATTARMVAKIKITAGDIRGLKELHQSLVRTHQALKKRHEAVEAMLYAPGTDAKRMVLLQSQANQLFGLMQDLEDQMRQVSGKMAGWDPATETSVTPVVPPGFGQGPAAPGADPLDLRKGR